MIPPNGAEPLAATQELADFIAGLEPAALPGEVVGCMRDALIDVLGCAVAGHAVEKGSIPVAISVAMGGAPEATVVGTSQRLPAPMAAYANGELINALDFDPILAPGHVSPYVVPPALAAAETHGASGPELLCGVAVAHEVGCRVAAALAGLRDISNESGTAYRLSPASGYGSTIFGSIAGAANVFRLDVPTTLDAMGLAGYAAPVPSLTKYLHAPHSFHAKYTSAGMVALAAFMSVRMAEAGYGGDDTVLDGEYGFWRMFASSSCNWEFMLGGLGKDWRLLKNELKPYPSFRMSHAAIEAFVTLVRTHGIDLESIDKVVVTADPISLASCYLNRTMHNHTDAQLSWPFVLAAAAYYEPGVAWQTDALDDPRVLKLADKVELEPSAAWGDIVKKEEGTVPKWLRSEVRISCDGRTVAGAVEHSTKGTPENPLTAAEVRDKFLSNTKDRLGSARAEDVLAMLDEIESLDDVRPLFELLGDRTC